MNTIISINHTRALAIKKITNKEYIVSLWCIWVASLDRLQKLVSNHLGIEVSESTISTIIVDFTSVCGNILDVVTDYLKKCVTKGTDETAMRFSAATRTHRKALTAIGAYTPLSDGRDDKAGACDQHEAKGKERKTTKGEKNPDAPRRPRGRPPKSNA